MLIYLVLDTILDEAFHIFSRLELKFLLFLELGFLFLQLLVSLPLQRHLLHHSVYGLVFLDAGLKLFRRDKWQIVLQVIEIRHLLILLVLRILDIDNVGWCKWIIYIDFRVLVIKSK